MWSEEPGHVTAHYDRKKANKGCVIGAAGSPLSQAQRFAPRPRPELRRGDFGLTEALHANQAGLDFVIGELACVHLKARAQIPALLARLPRVAAATEAETLYFLKRRRLFGRGFG